MKGPSVAGLMMGLLSAACVPGLRAVEPAVELRDPDEWRTYRSRHFVVHTDVSPDVAEQVDPVSCGSRRSP